MTPPLSVFLANVHTSKVCELIKIVKIKKIDKYQTNKRFVIKKIVVIRGQVTMFSNISAITVALLCGITL